ncbi:hypothetical protein [Dickeya ananatis]|uniref:hypothetical protein n=1 Tax=Dickeya ananatis TaxID=3061286 RepID=UPI00388E72CE
MCSDIPSNVPNSSECFGIYRLSAACFGPTGGIARCMVLLYAVGLLLASLAEPLYRVVAVTMLPVNRMGLI